MCLHLELFIQRDLGQLAHLIASTDDLALIPKTIIFSHNGVKWEWKPPAFKVLLQNGNGSSLARVGLSAHLQ